MIREYVAGDENRLSGNAYSRLDGLYIPDCYSRKTIAVCGRITAVVFWFEHEPRKIASFIMLAEGAGIASIRELKRLINELAHSLKPEQVITFSRDCAVLDRWHEFLGFKRSEDGAILVQGKRLNKWVMSWDWKQQL